MQGVEEEEIVNRPETVVLDPHLTAVGGVKERRCPPPGREANRQMQPRLPDAARKRPSCDVILRRPVPGPRAETFQNSKLTIGSTVSSRPEVFRIPILRRFPNDEQ